MTFFVAQDTVESNNDSEMSSSDRYHKWPTNFVVLALDDSNLEKPEGSLGRPVEQQRQLVP